jgi:glycosyltransferase involved in cell wall biosynthesis
MQITILDPGLLELSGHHFNYNKSIFKECQSRDIPVVIYSQLICDQKLMDILPIIPCFDISPYRATEINNREDMIDKYNYHNFVMQENLSSRANNKFSPDDIILAFTTTVNEISGILGWYANLENPKPRIILQFMHHPWYLGLQEDPDFCTALLQSAMGAWRGDDLRVTFAADNDLLANFLHRISGFPISILPMPIEYPTRSLSPDRPRHERVRFGFLGDGRAEKGVLHFVNAILMQQSANIPNAEFFIHISNHGGRFAQDVLADVSNCTVICKQFTTQEYWYAAEDCDVIVLPHDPRHYRIRGSGVLFEAMGLDKPVIVAEGSCLDWLMAKYGATGMRFDGTAQSLLNAVRTIANDFDDFKSIARIAGKQVRAMHNPKAFVDALLSGQK